MKRIIDTFRIQVKPGVFREFPIDREVPTPKDVREKLSYADAMAAIELMLVPEKHVRDHLRIGSTPPTRVAVCDIPPEHRRLQTLMYQTFGETYICLPE
jgi:hypothetical protein